jgi:hypothetical protein
MLRLRACTRLDLGIQCRLHQIVASCRPEGHAGRAQFTRRLQPPRDSQREDKHDRRAVQLKRLYRSELLPKRERGRRE